MGQRSSTTIVSGPFAEQSLRYKLLDLNFKTACDRLIQGDEVVCIRTGERLSMLSSDVFKVNFQQMDHRTFVDHYADEVFREGLDSDSCSISTTGIND